MGGFSLSEKLPFLFFCGFFECFGEGVCGFSGGILWGGGDLRAIRRGYGRLIENVDE